MAVKRRFEELDARRAELQAGGGADRHRDASTNRAS